MGLFGGASKSCGTSVKMLAVRVAVLGVLAAVVAGQEGSSSQGSLLNLPVYELCRDRYKQWKFNGKWYHFSWDSEARTADIEAGGNATNVKPATNGTKGNWLEARNDCRLSQHPGLYQWCPWSF